MLLQINKYQIDTLKDNDKIPIKCSNCGDEFHIKKSKIVKAIYLDKHYKFKYCSWFCGVENFFCEMIRIFTDKDKCPFKFSLLKNKKNIFRKRLSLFIIKDLNKRLPDLLVQSDKNILGFKFDIYIPSMKLGFIFRKVYNSIDETIKKEISEKINICNENGIKLYVFDIDTIQEFNNIIALEYSEIILRKILYDKNYI